MSSRIAAQDPSGAQANLARAKRSDTTLPPFVTCGGALTDLASAPDRTSRSPQLHSALDRWTANPNGGGESNFNDDPPSARAVFNDSTVPICQINSPVYSQAV